MIVVAIIGILASIGMVNYGTMVRKSADAYTKGNLGAMRSALSIYYSDNEGTFPYDDLSSLKGTSRYLMLVPVARILPYHGDTSLVTPETTVTETGGWSYNNSEADRAWGAVHVGCLHLNTKDEVWSTF